jgi:hypothetical protein
MTSPDSVALLLTPVLPWPGGSGRAARLLRKNSLRDDRRFKVIGMHLPEELNKLLARAAGVELICGLGVTAGPHDLHAESPAEFTAAVIRLASDSPLADRLAQAGCSHCKRCFSI